MDDRIYWWLGWLAVLVAWVGHAYIWTAVLNHVYGRPFSKRLLRPLRLFTGVVIAGFVVLFPIGTDDFMCGYVAACGVVGAAVFPAVTAYRCFRPRAAELLAETTHTLDVRAEVGDAVIGDGKWRRLATLPLNDIFRVELTDWTLAVPDLPPALDGLFIGGGFPELFMAELEANVSLRSALQRAIAAGLPTYAECGGLMYLARSISWKDQRAQMVGAIPGDVVMHARPVGRGYVRVEETGEFPWQDEASEPMLRLGHEFHHSSLQNLDPAVQFAYRVQRGHGIDGLHDGVMVNNLLASYTHLRHTGGNDWPRRFIAFVRRVREDAAGAADTAPLRVGGSTWSTR